MNQVVSARQHDWIEEQRIEISKLEKERDAPLQLAFRENIERHLAVPQRLVPDSSDSPDIVNASRR